MTHMYDSGQEQFIHRVGVTMFVHHLETEDDSH